VRWHLTAIEWDAYPYAMGSALLFSMAVTSGVSGSWLIWKTRF